MRLELGSSAKHVLYVVGGVMTCGSLLDGYGNVLGLIPPESCPKVACVVLLLAALLDGFARLGFLYVGGNRVLRLGPKHWLFTVGVCALTLTPLAASKLASPNVVARVTVDPELIRTSTSGPSLLRTDLGFEVERKGIGEAHLYAWCLRLGLGVFDGLNPKMIGDRWTVVQHLQENEPAASDDQGEFMNRFPIAWRWFEYTGYIEPDADTAFRESVERVCGPFGTKIHVDRDLPTRLPRESPVVVDTSRSRSVAREVNRLYYSYHFFVSRTEPPIAISKRLSIKPP